MILMLAQALCVCAALPGEDAQRQRVTNDTSASGCCVCAALPGEDAQRQRVMNDTNVSTGAVCLCSITR